ncbi:hypothetical protein [Halobacillus sp. BAB-2008]|uniref:hypothetical protein n=1 Tax=Halobacillus sp. BAB-2008 TaxID=1246484 RepID=UPI0002A51D76|nr:hypothetical protein [Halobacillus sp. BAB-2008]ELK44347.1 hypothetical protein D479_19473 [Halobacillus sp. BAB-2008]
MVKWKNEVVNQRFFMKKLWGLRLSFFQKQWIRSMLLMCVLSLLVVWDHPVLFVIGVVALSVLEVWIHKKKQA